MDIYNSKFPNIFKPKNKRAWAITLANITWYNVPKEEVSARWKAHEDCHKKQWRKYWYIGFAILYLWDLATKGYELNRFEIEANQK